jgi:superfamily I DNA/RNA helicase
MQRTKQQQDFIDAILAAARDGGGKHKCLRARAGTGKTSTLMELIDDYRPAFPKHEIALCAFNNAAAKELKAKLEEHGHTDWRLTQASTIHSLGLSLLKYPLYPFKPKVEEHKVRNLIDAQNGNTYREHSINIARLVSFAKLEGFGFFSDVAIGDISAWYRLADHYDINGFDDTAQLDNVIGAAQQIYRASLSQTDIIDFDDMILMPLVKNIRVRFQKDLLIVDEAQDTGRARQALLKKFVKEKTGILLIVGDDRQGIYGFAGAQADALDQFISDMNMTVLPLTVCWRCPQSVIERAQALVPDIEWAPGAALGTVTDAEALPDLMLATDAILCRNTAPLIEAAYALLRKGIACKVEGREIGQGLLRMVNRWKRVNTIDQFLVKLDDYRARETQKALARGNESKVDEINDRCETLVHLCNVCLDRRQSQLDDLRAFIETMFANDVAGVTTLCTYHRAKGREWSRVFLLEHSKRCPSPWAKQEWQKRQEENLAYVAITRARADLIFVN